MDKSWIHFPRNTPEYKAGLNKFLDFALEHKSTNGLIICPCSKCKFNKWWSRAEVYNHLICRRFPPTYTFWCRHGEKANDKTPTTETHATRQSNTMHEIITDAFGLPGKYNSGDLPTNEPDTTYYERRIPEMNESTINDVKSFFELFKDGEQPLYDGCSRFTKLSFLVKLYHIKCLYGISNKAISMVIELLHEAFEFAKIPESIYEAQKIINKLGLSNSKIDACPNNWRENQDLEECKVCHTSRWKNKEKQMQNLANEVGKKNDSLAQVLGPEHSGRVQGLGFGVTPSQAFASDSRHCGVTGIAYAGGTSDPKDLEIAYLKARVHTIEEQIGVVLNFLKKKHPESSELPDE